MWICQTIFLVLITSLAIPVATFGLAPQTAPQRACITKLNASGERLARAVARNLVDCVRLALAGRLAPGESAADCLEADPRERIGKARAKTVDVENRYCADPPDFGPTSASAVNGAFAAPLGVSKVFGPDLDAALAAGVGNAATARCQKMVAKRLRDTIRGSLRDFGICQRLGLRNGSIADGYRLADCYGKARPGRARKAAKFAAGMATVCAGIELTTAFPGECAGESIDGFGDCVDRVVDCDTSQAVEAADSIATIRPHVFVDGLATEYCGERPVADQSVARQWDEEILNAIRIDFPRPPIHARNLLHLSIAMWDAWAAYDPSADGYLFTEKHVSPDPQTDREVAISFAAYRILSSRYSVSPNAPVSEIALRTRMNILGFDPDFSEAAGNTPVAIGNRIGAAVLIHGQGDGSHESINYADPSYAPVNVPLIVKFPGTTMTDPNRWQPLALDHQIGQNGLPIPGNVQKFVGPQWGTVLPFAIDFLSLLPGPPPLLNDVATDAEFKAQAVEVIRFSSLLTPDDPTLIDISPAALGNNSLGANDGTGYAMNPVTGEPYAAEIVKRADFGRVLAEFWADGPNSETPPGHWNSLANEVVSHPLFERRFAGIGPLLDPLEWDVKMYLSLNGAVHDAAVGAWGTKRFYDFTRPIAMIRYMGGLGQSSDPLGPSYHSAGLPLVPGLVEVVTTASSAPGQRHEALADHVGEIAVLSWPGEPPDPETQYSGVRWVRAKEWVAYQRNTFVTPPFAGYVSGHSTFSRAAAEVLNRITGTPFFPGGLGSFTAPQNDYLVFEVGPSETVRLQWATYYDAADQAGQSRLWGGIHILADDFEGRVLGATIGNQAFDKAVNYFDGTAIP